MVLLLFPSLEGLWGSAVLSLVRSLEALVLVYRRREGPPARMGPSRLDLFCTGVTTSVAVDREAEAVPVAASSLPPSCEPVAFIGGQILSYSCTRKSLTCLKWRSYIPGRTE